MKELTSLDQKIFNLKIENIFSVISDFASYKNWFPTNPEMKLIKSTPEKIGSIIQIKTGIVNFKIELTRIIPNKEIIVSYTGAFEGQGIWYFFESTNGTKLLYEIDLKVKSPVVRFFSFFLNLTALHSKLMTQVFSGLEEYLNKTYNINKNGINNSNSSQSKIFYIKSD